MDIANGTATKPAGTNDDLSEVETSTIDFGSPDKLVGQLLEGRFFIERNLANSGGDEGGIGLVYLATDMKLERKVVVKILQESATKNDYICQKFLQEREALTRLKHHGIVKILEHGKLTDGKPFMVIEFIEGQSLRKVLNKEGKLELGFAAHLIESLTSALAHVHDEEIIHRDIKPENIMLTAQKDSFDHLSLIDFGIARVHRSKVADKTSSANVVGTIRYMSPEQHFGDTELSAASDIYSAAIVAYEMLTGQLPFQPKSRAESNEKSNSEMFKIKQEGVKTRPRYVRQDIPAPAERILLSALEFEKGRRPQNARDFGRDLALALRGTAPKKSVSFVKAILIALIGLFSVLAIFLWGYTYWLTRYTQPQGDLENKVGLTSVNSQDSIIKRNESFLPETFDRSYQGNVYGKNQTIPVTMQLIRNKSVLKGTAMTSKNDEISGTIRQDGNFEASSIPIGEDATGKWVGRIHLDGTVTGFYMKKGESTRIRFSLTEMIVDSAGSENK